MSALCDPDEVALTAAAATVGLEPTEHCFTDYVTMLDSDLVDAVLIATPMEFHAAQTIEALERNIHVLCEVTAAVSVAECRAVVEAASCSAAHYAMAYNFFDLGAWLLDPEKGGASDEPTKMSAQQEKYESILNYYV